MVKVKYLPSEKVVEIQPGNTIREAAITAGVAELESTCGGMGTCGKCLVQIQQADIAPPSPAEVKFLSSAQLSAGWALACQRKLFADTEVRVKRIKDVDERKIEVKRVPANLPLVPGIIKHFLKLPQPSTGDLTADWERLAASLPGNKIPFNLSVAAALPGVLRQDKFQVTAVLDENGELLAVEPGDTRSSCFGVAVDIGTTTVAAYLMDLNSGDMLASRAITNPQSVFGEDVITRINHAASRPEGTHQLQQRVVQGLNGILNKFIELTGIRSEEIYLAVVVGNTTMGHLFLGINPAYLAPAPFVPAYHQTVTVEAGELGLNILRTGKVTVLPNIAGYVGSDTVAVMLAARADLLKGITLIIDIGTNGEIILFGKERILTCSTAAGPAFEGMHIKHGMRAAEGAIEGVYINEDVELIVICGSKARGICGSGLLDAVAGMVKAGVINSSGRLASTREEMEQLPPALRQRLRREEGSSQFILAWGKDTIIGEDIAITQQDIRELQLAKGAIVAGAKILLKELEVEAGEIDQILLAGAFGNYIHSESALGIGLLPPITPERITPIGNAAGDGAKLVLLSLAEKEKALALARRAEHIELSSNKEFQNELINSLFFAW